jgi:signal peptidase I
MIFFQRRKQRKRLHALAHHARGLRHMREDVMSAADLGRLDAAVAAAEEARHGDDLDAMESAETELGACIDALTPTCSLPAWRENFEVLVVALGVAMAFRAYFYQPFQIPTGSMQPTLYGISSREQPQARACDTVLLKAPNWLASGEWFSRVETRRTGKVAMLFQDDRVPGYTTLVSGRWSGALPYGPQFAKDSFVARHVHALGARLGVLDRGFDVCFIPNDAVQRHAGILRPDYFPAPGVQAQVADALRKLAPWLKAAAADDADDDTLRKAISDLYPLVLNVSRLAIVDALDEEAARGLLPAARTFELMTHREPVPRTQYQAACRGMLPVVARWAEAAAAGTRELPWFPLVSGCGAELPAGQLLWSGVVTEGDFVFVNRWAWNLRWPRRGEVMVFSTTGIPNLQQGTHYIKRMCGLPNERLSVNPPELWINGRAVYEPHTIARVARKQKLAAWAPPYAGYRVVGDVDARYARALRTSEDSIQLGPDEYFAMGDNTPNSLDSRYWGPVPRRNLLGPAACVYWPFTSKRWGRIE